jgi:hypothetical protein
MNQLAKLDFWTEAIYKQADGVYSKTVLETTDYVNKSSGGMLSTNIGFIVNYRGASTRQRGETLYLTGGKYYGGSYFINNPTTAKPVLTAQSLDIINGASYAGAELHQNSAGSRPYQTDNGFVFIIDSKKFQLKWTTDAGVVLYQDASPLTWDGGNALTSPENFVNIDALPEYSALKIKFFVINDGSNNNNLYIKFYGVQGIRNQLGWKKVALTSGATKPSFTYACFDSADGDGGNVSGYISNISLYGITSDQASTYAANIDGTPTNDMLPFQRYTPFLDLIPIFGTGWTGSDEPVAADDLSDGDLTTFATTEDKDAPIGFIASDGVTNVITNNEWFMVAAGGVGENFSSVGGPASGVLHDVFLATSGATIGTNSVYPLLTMGDLMGRTYAWTPGTLTQLPTIGIIRSGGSMAFSVANTEAEDIRFKFGVPVDGDNVNAFNYVQKDVTTGGNPFGETLATNNFDDGAGEFTDGTNTHTFTTAQPLIFTLERKS